MPYRIHESRAGENCLWRMAKRAGGFVQAEARSVALAMGQSVKKASNVMYEYAGAGATAGVSIVALGALSAVGTTLVGLDLKTPGNYLAQSAVMLPVVGGRLSMDVLILGAKVGFSTAVDAVSFGSHRSLTTILISAAAIGVIGYKKGPSLWASMKSLGERSWEKIKTLSESSAVRWAGALAAAGFASRALTRGLLSYCDLSSDSLLDAVVKGGVGAVFNGGAYIGSVDDNWPALVVVGGTLGAVALTAYVVNRIINPIRP